MSKIKWILLAACLIVLVYARFVNLSWGLPYPMHPDERNMVNAIQNLNCEIPSTKNQVSNCFNPHFFAYGQFPLYLAYFFIQFSHLITTKSKLPISFEEGAVALRSISALVSIVNAIVLVLIIKLISDKNPKSEILNSKQILNSNYKLLIALLLIIFSPFFIQFSHFGTTESLLMMFYSILIYLTILFFKDKIQNSKFIILTAIISGMAIATKVSSLIFLFVPFLGILKIRQQEEGSFGNLINTYFILIKWGISCLLFSIIFSPYNFITFGEFLGSMKYESDVALGSYIAFYTRQFVSSVPVVFQFIKIFPYTLGWPILILFFLGFIFLSWKDRSINLLRIAFLIYFIPNAYMFAKWARFMAPIMPITIVIAILFLISFYSQTWKSLKLKVKNEKLQLKIKSLLLILLVIISILPGIAYISIYQNQDVRFAASEWVYNNIPENALILSETANVVDIPIPGLNMKYPVINYQYISFDFYNVDRDIDLQQRLNNYINTADFIFIPSRRLFANHPINKYPVLNDYYRRLFSGELGFEKVAEFSSYPRISFFGKTIIEFPDEKAEETWTVFDHPVIRIYKRVNSY